MFCSMCGQEHPDNAKFCSSCGCPLLTGQLQSQAEQFCQQTPNNETSVGVSYKSYRLSWVAYARVAVKVAIPGFFFLCVACLLLLTAGLDRLDIDTIGIVGGLIIIAILVYSAFGIHSTVLYTDDDGVWLFGGLLPWNKCRRGTIWRDIESAVYYTGFFSWAFNSYKVRIGHRFTKTSELIIADVKNGRDAVSHINEILYTKYRQ